MMKTGKPTTGLWKTGWILVIALVASIALGIAGPAEVASGASQVEKTVFAHKRRAATAPCYVAFPNARSKSVGRTTWHNRQASVRMVLCYRFGLEPSADFPVSASMICGMLAEVIGRGVAKKLGIFATGVCSGAELAAAPREPARYIGVVCGWASTLLKSIPASLGCTLAPSAGHSLGAMFESKHELDVAVDVVRHGKCIKYSPSHFGSPWLAVACGHGDHGFASLPRVPSGSGGGGEDGGGAGPGDGSAPGGDSSPAFKGQGKLIVNPPNMVAGQSFNLQTTEGCPAGTNSAGVEILPEGATFDGETDATHATYGLGGVNRPDGPYGGHPDLLPGSYEILAECLHGEGPWAYPPAQVLFVYRTSLTVTGAGRSISLQPTEVPEEGTITIGPEEPCAGLTGGTVYLYISEPLDQPYELGMVGSSCEWSPVSFKLPADVTAGQHTAEVLVVAPDERTSFRYKLAHFVVD
ncbi:MAG TPA: hypothetical protein VG898_05895 [Solirubrobacterales bacterium]|nr:hypothetical protein [Solirubrobacterales bacterium]